MRNKKTYKTPANTAHRSQHGFSAIEVTMVATIIAILALIALPTFLERLKDSRIKATMDEMNQLAKGLQLAKADTSFYPRLQDLDNNTLFSQQAGGAAVNVEVPADAGEFVPSAYWNQLFIAGGSERARLARRWKGVYTPFQISKVLLYEDIVADPDFRNLLSINGGPVPDRSPSGALDTQDDQFPLDAWDGPYIFFGTGFPINAPAGSESSFNARLYSLGPDGLPGDGQPYTPANLFPENGIIGTGDDLIYMVQ